MKPPVAPASHKKSPPTIQDLPHAGATSHHHPPSPPNPGTPPPVLPHAPPPRGYLPHLSTTPPSPGEPPPSPPITPHPGAPCPCLPANWRVLTNPIIRSRAHLFAPGRPVYFLPRGDITAAAGGATPNAHPPALPASPPTPAVRPRHLPNSPGPANWPPPPGDLAPAPIRAATRPRRPLARS